MGREVLCAASHACRELCVESLYCKVCLDVGDLPLGAAWLAQWRGATDAGQGWTTKRFYMRLRASSVCVAKCVFPLCLCVCAPSWVCHVGTLPHSSRLADFAHT